MHTLYALGGDVGGRLESLFRQIGGHVAGGIQRALLSRFGQGSGGDLLKLLGECTPPLHGINHTGRGFGGVLGGGLRGCRCSTFRGHFFGRTGRSVTHGMGSTSKGFTRFVYAVHDSICGLEFESVGHITHAEVHTLERCQCHFLHFQRLDSGSQRARVLLQPKLHGFQLGDTLVQLFDTEGRRHPTRQAGHVRQPP